VTSEQTVDWLVQEMSDYLDAGSVGLYEFVNELEDRDHPMPLDERKVIARQALDRLLQRGDIEIQWRRWGTFDNLGTVQPTDLPGDPWQSPTDDNDGMFLAIKRT
jgi:hypothetical protein